MTWTTSPHSAYDLLRSSLSLLHVGGSFVTRNVRISTFGYNYAKKLRIRINVHRNEDGTYTVTRVA